MHIPGCGDLVLGGVGVTGTLRNAELMETISTSGSRIHAWRQIDPMIKARFCLSAVYFSGAVYAVSIGERTVEMLSLSNNQPGHWTLIFEKNPPSGFTPWSVCVFNGRILASCELENI